MQSLHKVLQEEGDKQPMQQQHKAIRQFRNHHETGPIYSAGIAMDTVISWINAHLHHVKVEVEAVIDGIIASNEEVVVEEEGDVEVSKDQLMPHWYRQN